MNECPARIGAPLDEIDTPALVVDLDAFERNLNKMAAFAAERGVRLRPHAKTHKCPTVARKQIAAGAVGQCCQKVGEAEALVRGGVRDVLVSNEVVGAQKLRRLAALAHEATIALCFDAPEQVAAASRAATDAGVELGALVEIDVGMQRCGVAAPEAARELALADRAGAGPRASAASRRITARRSTWPPWDERRAAIDRAADVVRAAAEALRGAGLDCALISGAGTGTFRMEGESGLWNELQAGSYLFMDTEYARIGGAGRRALRRVRAQPVRARDRDEHADRGPRDRRCGAQIVQRGERLPLGAWPAGSGGHGRIGRAWPDPHRS